MPESQQAAKSPLEAVSAALYEIGKVDLAVTLHTIAAQMNTEDKSGRV